MAICQKGGLTKFNEGGLKKVTYHEGGSTKITSHDGGLIMVIC